MKFKELKIWQESHQLTLEIYKLTKLFPKSEVYGISSQIQRSSSSVPANIVEGYNRKGSKEFIQFLYQARGSLSETEYFIILSTDLGYIEPTKSNELLSRYESLSKMLSAFISYIKKSS